MQHWKHYFNPLPPYGGRLTSPFCISTFSPFQSTPSVWRETKTERVNVSSVVNFNPLPPYGGRRESVRTMGSMVFYFNPLPPYGGRPSTLIYTVLLSIFQSTPSVWRETRSLSQNHTSQQISIHSLRMEGDHSCFFLSAFQNNFNPLPPYGGRRWKDFH